MHRTCEEDAQKGKVAQICRKSVYLASDFDETGMTQLQEQRQPGRSGGGCGIPAMSHACRWSRHELLEDAEGLVPGDLELGEGHVGRGEAGAGLAVDRERVEPQPEWRAPVVPARDREPPQPGLAGRVDGGTNAVNPRHCAFDNALGKLDRTGQ